MLLTVLLSQIGHSVASAQCEYVADFKSFNFITIQPASF